MQTVRLIPAAPALLAALLLGACSPGEPAQSQAAAETAGDRLSQAAIKETYLRSCYSCHNSGVNGAPRTGDSAAWGPRLAKGMDTLVANTISGYRAMPPRGLCFDCSEAEFEALIRYMSGEQAGPG